MRRAPRSCLPLLAAGLVLLAACAQAGMDPDGIRERELVYLRKVIDDPALLAVSHIEAASEDRVQLQGHEGEGIGLRIEPGDHVAKGQRCEVSCDPVFGPGDTVVYRWRLLLPADFGHDEPANRWIIVGQWHDQPDRTLGERWEDFPPRSPVIALCYGRRDGKDMLAVEYGVDERQAEGPWPLQREVWLEIEARITWHRDARGAADVRFRQGDRTWRASFAGSNQHNDYRHYFKTGIYRSPEIAGPTRIVVDDIGVEVLGQGDADGPAPAAE